MMEMYSDNTWRCSALLYKMLSVALISLIGLSQLVSTRHISDTSSNLDFRISRNSPHTECSIHQRIRQINPHGCGDPIKDTNKSEIIVEDGKEILSCKVRGPTNASFEQIMKWYKNGTEAVGVPDCYKLLDLCCFVAQMGNNINFCPDGKHLACYNGKDKKYNPLSMPLCDPPLEEEKTKLNCKCYQSNTSLCDEESLSKCNEAPDNKECLHIKETYDNTYRCVCSPVDGDAKLHLKSCSELGATETNAVHEEENTTN